MVRKLLASRPDLCATPELAPWSGNYGSKINGHIQGLLKKCGSTIPGAAEVVNREVSLLAQAKKTATPVKSGKTSTASTPTTKKRKRATNVKDERVGEDFDDY